MGKIYFGPTFLDICLVWYQCQLVGSTLFEANAGRLIMTNYKSKLGSLKYERKPSLEIKAV